MENSRLNSLPGELRNRIYRFALIVGDGIELGPENMSIVTPKTRDHVVSAFNLLSTCKQIRAEALPIFFAENDFVFGADLLAGDEDHALKETWKLRLMVAGWLSTIGASAQHIQRVRFHLGLWQAWDQDEDWLTRTLPGIVKNFQALFMVSKKLPVIGLTTNWNTYTKNRSFEATFWDAPSARRAFDEGFEDEIDLTKTVRAEWLELPLEEYANQIGWDKQESRSAFDELVEGLQSALGS